MNEEMNNYCATENFMVRYSFICLLQMNITDGNSCSINSNDNDEMTEVILIYFQFSGSLLFMIMK